MKHSVQTLPTMTFTPLNKLIDPLLEMKVSRQLNMPD